MKIKRLDIVGFKSFVDRTTVEFQQGITGVVGPNGCGKSNIVDAIRWVMGEQSVKNLRGRSMEDVIFAGSEKRKPTGRAEVSLTLENNNGAVPPAYRDFPEITVTRRLYRNGDSEYLINKTPCRLMDITELFMDTGAGARAYSIIEQGKIGTILSAKPEERRALIEEAAGVTKFKMRRKAAQRKMDATRQNLLRISDVVSEVRRQMNSLKRQAQRAEQYRELRQQTRELEIGLAAEEFTVLSTNLATVQAEAQQCGKQLEDSATQLQQQELQLEEARVVQAAREKDYSDGQQRVLHLSGQIQRIEGDLALGDKEQESLLRQKDRHRMEQEEAVLRLQEMSQEETSLQQLGQGITVELEQEEGLLQEQQQDLDRLSTEEREMLTELDQARSAMMTLIREQNRLQQRYQEVQQRLTGLDERQSRCTADRAALHERGEEVGARLAQVDDRLQAEKRHQRGLAERTEELQEEVRVQRAALEKGAASLLRLRNDFSGCRSRINALQEIQQAGEGLDDGLRELLKTSPAAAALTHRVADLFDVPAAYEVAMEAVLGERLQALVADSVEPVSQLIGSLEADGGCGTFLVPCELPLPQTTPPGGRPLFELIAAGKEPTTAIQGLLAGVYLVDDLTPYLSQRLAAGTLLVTVGGRVLQAGGIVKAGTATGTSAGLLQKKRELKELEVQSHQLQEAIDNEDAQQQQRKDAIAEAEEEMAELRVSRQAHDRTLVETEKEHARLLHESEQTTERLDRLLVEEEELHDLREGLTTELTQVEAERQEDETAQLERQERVEQLQEQQLVLRREVEALREKVTSLRVTVAGLKERSQGSVQGLTQLRNQRGELQQRQQQLTLQLEQGVQEFEDIDQRKVRLRSELEVLLQKRQEEQGASELLRTQFEEQQFVLEEKQEGYRTIRGRVEGVRETFTNLQLRERELSLEQEHLRQSVIERHRMDLLEEACQAPDDWDVEVARKRLQDLRSRIERLGEVNLTAIEEFQELEERFAFLSTQQEDLQQSLDELQQAISRINRTTRQRFKETFEQVNAQFKQVFPRLFRGGRAELALTDENDLLETGIDIIAQPPGKRLQNVNLLSGGEKALTAVALIFSLFIIKPSPFCLLDEVDAPLDDANIGRFADMVTEMAKGTQFVVITHNKQTMEGADVMYGVTMEEPGASKIVSVRMDGA